MSKSLNLGLIVLAISILLAGITLSNLQVKSKAYERSVEVKGLAEKEVKADLGVWPIQVTLAGNDLSVLKKDIDTQKEMVIEFFSEQGFNKEEFNAGPTNIQDGQANVYSGNQNARFRYIAQMEFTVRTGDLEKLQNALTASLELVSEGILIGSRDTWRPIQYLYTQLNDIKPQMIEEATKNAREVAEKFAMDSNSAVGKIKSARQGIFSISDRDQNTPYVKKVRVVTTIDYFLKD